MRNLDCIKIQIKQDLSPLQHHSLQFVPISHFINHMQKKNTLLLYLDATGTVVAKLKDCKSLLYYALCSPVTSTTSTTVAVAEMYATTLEEVDALLTDICEVFIEDSLTFCQESLNNLHTAFENQAVVADVKVAEVEDTALTKDTTPKTIRHDSPFVKCFEDTLYKTKEKSLTRKEFRAPTNPNTAQM